MADSVLFIGPERTAHAVFHPLWNELDLERYHCSSAEAALEIVRNGDAPRAILVSYPLWDSSLDDLLFALDRVLKGERPGPIVVLAPAASLFEVAGFEDRGVTVLAEDKEPEELRSAVRGLLVRVLRAHPRTIVRMAVQVGAGQLLRVCQTEDLSASGMLIRTSEEFPIGSAVKLEFSVLEDEEPIRCQAQVVRYTQPDVEKARGMGVHFQSFEENDRERLEDFLT
jgi:Tfp pilus assembly protein PilZ